MNDGDKDMSETESDFEYVDKNDTYTETDEGESDSKEDTLLNIEAEVIKMEQEIDAEASNIVKVSEQLMFLQPLEDDECVKENSDDETEIDGEELEIEIESQAACLEQMMPKTQSEVEMEDSEESDSEEENRSEEHLFETHKGTRIVTDSTDSDSNTAEQRCLILSRQIDLLSNAEETEYPESVQNSDSECLLSDSDVKEVGQSEQTVGGSQCSAESVISAILSDVLSSIDNMLEADNDNDDDIQSVVNYSADDYDSTAVSSAATETAVRPSSEAGLEAASVVSASCDDYCQEILSSEARQIRDNSPATSHDTEQSCNQEKEFIQEDVVQDDTDLVNTMSSSSVKINEEESEFELYSLEDLDNELTMEDTDPSVTKLAELKDWLDSKEKEVNDMFDIKDDTIDEHDNHEESNTETILDVQKDFNIQAEILKQLTESILASSTEVKGPQERFSDTGEKILDSSSVLISPLTVDSPSRHKYVRKSSGNKMKKNISVKSPLLRRKEIRTCINLHNDCENSDVLHEIISPALNFGAPASVAVNGDLTHPDIRPEVPSRLHLINHDREESLPECQIEQPRKLDVSCKQG